MKNTGFTLIEFCILIAIIGILLVIIIPLKDSVNVQNTQEITTGKTEFTDGEILYSRKYVLDFDQRMERANEQIKSCVGPVTDYKVLNSCTATAYNAQGWTYSDYGKGTSLNVNTVEEYNKHKIVSMQSLSTEL